MPLSVTVKLYAKDVEQIVKDHLRKEGYEATSIRFMVEERGSDPRDLDRHHVFVGVEADAVRKS